MGKRTRIRDGKDKFYKNLHLPEDLREVIRLFRQTRMQMMKESDERKRGRKRNKK